MRIKRILGLSLTILGSIFSLVALGAEVLGIDQEGGWGPARSFLLGSGLLLILLPHLRRGVVSVKTRISRSKLRHLFPSPLFTEGNRQAISKSNRESDTRRKGLAEKTHRKAWIHLQLLSCFVLTTALFTFFVSVGRWDDWLITTRHFHLLAEGFRQGHTYLTVEPDPALLELEDPYSFENRENIEQVWDASLYDGKYYLYWGPVPALVTLAIESTGANPIDDPHLTWLFLIGMVLLGLLILRELWFHEFQALPAWSVLPPALVVSLSNPLPWVMSRPAVYEAAITAGQFFLLAAIFSILILLRSIPGKSWQLAIPGTILALAFGSRLTLLPAAIFILLVSLIRISHLQFAERRLTSPGFLATLSIIFAPILLGLGALAVYNYVRFGSVLEFGHRYQLTLEQFGGAYATSFSTKNIITNTYNYLANPIRVIPTFPFIKPLWGGYSVPFLHTAASDVYHTEQISGVLLSTPFALFSVSPLVSWGKALWDLLEKKPLREIFNIDVILGGWHWFYITLLGCSAFAFTTLLLLSYTTMRYLLDFLPSILLASSLGYAFYLQKHLHTRSSRVALALTGMAASMYSAAVGLLLGITGYFANFEHFNPGLFDKINRFFSF